MSANGRLLQSGNRAARETVRMTKSDVSNVLSEILLEGVDVHRCAAARALGKIADPGSVDALKKALLDQDPDVRADVAGALGEIAPEGGTEGCAEALMENLLTTLTLMSKRRQSPP